jgi:hypothetical protein
VEFSDPMQCGCGCLCRKPNEPGVHYLGNSYADPTQCLTLNVGCNADQVAFNSSCGCGCLDAK